MLSNFSSNKLITVSEAGGGTQEGGGDKTGSMMMIKMVVVGGIFEILFIIFVETLPDFEYL